MPLRVFISHAFKDKAPVEALATALRTLHGVDTWLDHWEIDSAQDIVARINDGLERSQAGLLVYSANAAESEWVKKELSYLIYAHITEGKPLIPVVMDGAPPLPPLIRPFLWRHISDVQAIADAIHNRKPARPGVENRHHHGEVEKVLITLSGEGTAVHTTVTMREHQYATAAARH